MSSQQLTIGQALSKAKKVSKQGQIAVAIQLYKTVLQSQPSHPIASKRLRQLQEKTKHNQSTQTLAIQPSQVQINALINLYQSGQLEKTENTCKNILKAYPRSFIVFNILGTALQGQGKLKNAVQAYNEAIHLQSDYAEAYNNRAAALKQLGQLEKAIESYNKAIQLQPNYAGFYNNRGVAFQELGQINKAIESYNKAIQLQPDYAKAYNNHGMALLAIGQPEKAIESYKKAIQLQPDYAKAYNNLLMSLNYTSNFNFTDVITIANQFGKFVTEKAKIQFSSYQCLSFPIKLRIGFVSGDLRNHPVGYFLESVLSCINFTMIELIAYPTTPKTDELSKRIKPFFSIWRSIYGKDDETAANLIHADGIHILIDLSGHTKFNRLPMFSLKPSPIQVSWLGYFSTTGVNEIDYLLGDPYLTPPSNEKHFTEKIWRLPETRWCFTPPSVDIEVATLPALNNEYVTFGCFSNLSKINNKTIKLWAKVINLSPNSRLLLKAKQLSDLPICKSVMQQFVTHGVNSNRIKLETSENREKYFEAYNRVDIMLDTFPFSGGTTSIECLWMGVPILTLAGDSLVSRQGVGILMNAGLPDWIAYNEDEYITKSFSFASDLDKLASLRSRLREQVVDSPLFDAQRFARNFENALWGMWDEYQD